MAKIAEAYVEISARLDKMNADLNRAKSDFAKASGQMQTQANALSGSITKIKASYALAAGVIGGPLSAQSSQPSSPLPTTSTRSTRWPSRPASLLRC